jgi:hypothetical protein
VLFFVGYLFLSSSEGRWILMLVVHYGNLGCRCSAWDSVRTSLGGFEMLQEF